MEEAEENQLLVDAEMRTMIGQGIWLTGANVVLTFTGFLFWVVIGLLTTSSIVGFASTAFGLATLLSGLLNFGLSYSTLTEVSVRGKAAFSASALIAVVLGAIGAASAWAFTGLYGGFHSYVALVSVMVAAAILGVTTRQTLIAIRRARLYFSLSIISVVTRFVVAVVLLRLGFEGLGITWGSAAQLVVTTTVGTLIAVKVLGIEVPSAQELKIVGRRGIANYAATLQTIFMSGGVVILSYLTSDSSKVGVFYLALLASAVASSFAASVALALLPAMMKAKSQFLSGEALRFGLSITLVLALPLAVFAQQVLAVLGPTYVPGDIPLSILAWAALPTAAQAIALSRNNAINAHRRIAISGAAGVGSLLVSLPFLYSLDGLEGAAYAFLLSITVGFLIMANRKEILRVGLFSGLLGLLYLGGLGLDYLQVYWVLKLVTLEGAGLVLLLVSRSIGPKDFRLVAGVVRAGGAVKPPAIRPAESRTKRA